VVRGPEVLSAPFPAISAAVEQLLRRARLLGEAPQPSAEIAAPPPDESHTDITTRG
jgi:hypothetical protein